jgi:hypothetical protein
MKSGSFSSVASSKSILSINQNGLVVLWSRSTAYMSFSITFEKEVSKDIGL